MLETTPFVFTHLLKKVEKKFRAKLFIFGVPGTDSKRAKKSNTAGKAIDSLSLYGISVIHLFWFQIIKNTCIVVFF